MILDFLEPALSLSLRLSLPNIMAGRPGEDPLIIQVRGRYSDIADFLPIRLKRLIPPLSDR